MRTNTTGLNIVMHTFQGSLLAGRGVQVETPIAPNQKKLLNSTKQASEKHVGDKCIKMRSQQEPLRLEAAGNARPFWSFSSCEKIAFGDSSCVWLNQDSGMQKRKQEVESVVNHHSKILDNRSNWGLYTFFAA